MKFMVLAVTLITAGLVQAADGEHQPNAGLHGINDQASPPESADAPVKLSRQKRGVGPVVGMPCEGGYRLVGDDCVMSNVEFE
jgi:hypothetical protein